MAIIAHQGFTVRPGETRVLRRSRRQDVTGVVVNSKPNVSRRELKRFRATLHQVEKDGPAGKRWGRSPDVLASLQGFANFVHMVNPGKGAGLQRRVRAVAEKHNWEPARVAPRPAPRKPGTPRPDAPPVEAEPEPPRSAPARKK
jgi:RNA-directed DNA polymerase